MLIYTGAVMAILYYCGITQLAAIKMAWLMQVTMGTTSIETLGVASNIFLHGVRTTAVTITTRSKQHSLTFTLLIKIPVNFYMTMDGNN